MNMQLEGKVDVWRSAIDENRSALKLTKEVFVLSYLFSPNFNISMISTMGTFYEVCFSFNLHVRKPFVLFAS